MKVLFRAKLKDTLMDGEWDYFCEDGVGYRDYERNPFAWRVRDGHVEFRSLSGFNDEAEVWRRDTSEVQLAYQQYLSRLVTEEAPTHA